MISDPDKYIPAFVDAGAAILTVHAEATVHLDRTLNFIRSQNVLAGVSINPATPLSAVEHALAMADMLLIMTVNPGFGGQKFIPYTVEKIRRARQVDRGAELSVRDRSRWRHRCGHHSGCRKGRSRDSGRRIGYFSMRRIPAGRSGNCWK